MSAVAPPFQRTKLTPLFLYERWGRCLISALWASSCNDITVKYRRIYHKKHIDGGHRHSPLTYLFDHHILYINLTSAGASITQLHDGYFGGLTGMDGDQTALLNKHLSQSKMSTFNKVIDGWMLAGQPRSPSIY